MRHFALVLTLLAIAAGFIIWQKDRADTPQRAVGMLLDNLQKGKFKKADALTTAGLGLDANTKRAKKLYQSMYSDMRYVIADSVISGDQAQITVSVTMVDMVTLLEEVTLDLLSRSLSGKGGGDKELYTALAERIAEGDAVTMTTTAIVLVVRTEDGWKVDSDRSAAFLIAITGGVGPLVAETA